MMESSVDDNDLDGQVARFLVEVHSLIDEVAERYSLAIIARLEASPPNERVGELRYELGEFGRALMFHVCGLMDGVGDPSLTRESWDGLRFEHRSEDSPMLHDAFMEALATYQGLRHDRS